MRVGRTGKHPEFRIVLIRCLRPERAMILPRRLAPPKGRGSVRSLSTGNLSQEVQKIFGPPRVGPITGFLIATKNINQEKLWHTNLYIQPWRPPLVEETDALKVQMAL
jgi:hypothetical protein